MEGEKETQQSPIDLSIKPPEPFALVLFGATGDLAGRKLFPALKQLLKGKYLPPEFVIIGVGRRGMNDEEFRDAVQRRLSEESKGKESDDTTRFLSYVFYQQADFTTAEGMKGLLQRLNALERELNLTGNRLFYLATDPEFFLPIVEGIAGD